mmetsp:Transcript_111121/g.293511  ORF Transcript_111121/g.293511 Transcript_111121/m.293511 type:complete len:269 (-) Transcript_111121:15-821(-)
MQYRQGQGLWRVAWVRLHRLFRQGGGQEGDPGHGRAAGGASAGAARKVPVCEPEEGRGAPAHPVPGLLPSRRCVRYGAPEHAGAAGGQPLHLQHPNGVEGHRPVQAFHPLRAAHERQGDDEGREQGEPWFWIRRLRQPHIRTASDGRHDQLLHQRGRIGQADPGDVQEGRRVGGAEVQGGDRLQGPGAPGLPEGAARGDRGRSSYGREFGSQGALIAATIRIGAGSVLYFTDVKYSYWQYAELHRDRCTYCSGGGLAAGEKDHAQRPE